MELYTTCDVPSINHKICHEHKIMAMGSCFAENIGELLRYHLFDILINPLGIAFHPYALENILKGILNPGHIDQNRIVIRDGFYVHLDYHYSLRARSKEELHETLVQSNEETKTKIKNLDWLILSLGTSWYFEYLADRKSVNNCHKNPQKNFAKKLSDVESINASLKSAVEYLKKLSPDLKTIISISPIRHTKEGLINNQVSKSTLRLSAHQLEKSLEDCYYFPSYEIMMDELRDYRFYKDDLIRPDKTAQAIIWERFSGSIMAKETLEINSIIDKARKFIAHKSLNPENATSDSKKERLLQITKNLSPKQTEVLLYELEGL